MKREYFLLLVRREELVVRVIGVVEGVGVRLVERDRTIMREISRWRFLLSRQIKILCGFSGQRACDRRLAKLIEMGYIERKYFIYGIPRLYFVTKKAVKLFDLDYYTPNIRIEQIEHEIAVVDTAIYLIKNGIDSNTIITERDLKHNAGFGNPKHYPDFIYKQDEQNYCVEVELSVKKEETISKNIEENYLNYDIQKWVVSDYKLKILEYLKKSEVSYPNIEILSLERVKNYVSKL